jgi:hypothetical protein
LRAATRADPTFAEAWYNLGDLLDEEGRSEAAIDTVGTHGTDWSGVWLVDRPLDCDDTDNVSVDTILAVSLDCGPSDLSDYEWAQDGQSHQEWLIPADFVNKHTLAIVQLDPSLRRSA